jgi:hypothetical protein
MAVAPDSKPLAALKAVVRTSIADSQIDFRPGEGHGFEIPADLALSMSRTVIFFGARIT